MTELPGFSVAMSVYKNDDPRFLRRALDSITKDQTIKPDEVVLVVDGPVGSKLRESILEYEEMGVGIKPIWLEVNGGLGNALRVAVEHCSHDLVARMDSDDVSVPDRFEQQLRVFSFDHDADIVGGDISEFVEDETSVISLRNVPCENEDIKAEMKKSCAMNHMSVMFKKEAVLDAGGYLDWHYNEDYYLWIRMMLRDCKFVNTGTVLVNVRVGQDMYSRRGGAKYFVSERNLQKYMLDYGVINRRRYALNVIKRFLVQVVLPDSMRGFVYRTFARKAV